MTRKERIGELIKEHISTLLKKKVADPRIGFVSITDVEVSPDLRSAKIFVSIYGSEKERNETMRGLASAKGYIQGEVGRALELRNTPFLTFIQDKSIERGSRVLAIMSKLEKEASECERLYRTKKDKTNAKGL